MFLTLVIFINIPRDLESQDPSCLLGRLIKIGMQTLANHQMKTALVHFGVTEGPKQNFIVMRFKIIIKLNQPN